MTVYEVDGELYSNAHYADKVARTRDSSVQVLEVDHTGPEFFMVTAGSGDYGTIYSIVMCGNMPEHASQGRCYEAFDAADALAAAIADPEFNTGGTTEDA